MKKDEQKTSHYDKELNTLDKLAKNLIELVDPEYKSRSIIAGKQVKYQGIIDRQLNLAKGVSDGSIVDFIYATRQEAGGIKPTQSEVMVDSADIFNQNNSDIFGYFQEMYKNKFLEYTDLKFISKFIPSIGEAVKITLDYICSADSMSDAVARVIKLPDNIDKNTKELIMSEIKKMEKEMKLLKHLKNTVFKNTIVTGNHYVYAKGYKHLFEEYTLKQANGKFNTMDGAPFKNKKPEGKAVNMNYSLESTICQIGDSAESIVMETLVVPPNIVKDEMINSLGRGKEIEGLAKDLQDNLSTFHFVDVPIPFDSLEEVGYAAMEATTKNQKSDIIVKNYGEGTYHSNLYNNKEDLARLKKVSNGADGTIGSTDAQVGKKAEQFDINGTYIKYIESKNLIPIETLNTRVGYYHILPTTSKSSTKKGGKGGSMLSSSSLFTSANISQQKKDEAVQSIADSISSSIVQQFNSKFVSTNAKYKKIIADCIIANGIVNNEFMIQFIPPEDIIEFKINDDENGNGESILANALFPAKLLLSIMICKMLNYVNNSGNKTIAHIYKGPIGTSTKNQLDRVVRNMQETNATFNDLISPNLMFAKFARDNRIALPRSKSGNKLVELETQEGQQIDMNTDYENKLEKMAILGTGVPSTFMDRIDDTQFSRQIIADNIKFATKISSLQADLEDPLTDLYKKLCENSTLPDDAKQIVRDRLEIKLPRPSVLSNSNNSDQLQTLSALAQLASNIVVGENNQDPNAGKIKDQLTKMIVTENSPFFDWENIDKLYQQVIMDISSADVETEGPSM